MRVCCSNIRYPVRVYKLTQMLLSLTVRGNTNGLREPFELQEAPIVSANEHSTQRGAIRKRCVRRAG